MTKEEELQNVKISICQNCEGWVTASDEDYLNENRKAKKDFMNDVFKHNLKVRTLTRIEWKDSALNMCGCD